MYRIASGNSEAEIMLGRRGATTIRGLAIVILFIALGLAAWLKWRPISAAEQMQRLEAINPAMPSSFISHAAKHDGYLAGQAIPITARYELALYPSLQPPGIPVQFLMESWLQEFKTGTVVDWNVQERQVVSGPNPRLPGTTAWDGTVQDPGQYFVCSRLSFRVPGKAWRELGGSRSMIVLVSESPETRPMKMPKRRHREDADRKPKPMLPGK